MHEPQHVLGGQVRAQHARPLPGGQQPVDGLVHRLVAAGDQFGVLAEGLHHRAGQAALGDEVTGQHPQPRGERLLGRGTDDQPVGLGADGGDLAAEDRRLQVDPGGEMPVERADPHAGPPGDVVQRGVRAVLRERGGGGLDEPGTAAPRVRAHLLLSDVSAHHQIRKPAY